MTNMFTVHYLYFYTILLMFGTHVTEADSADLEDLYVGTLLPFSGEGWPGGEAQNHSIAIAVDSINNRSDMLSGYRLKLVIVDDECSPGIATYRMFQLLESPPRKVALLGPSCSPCVAATSAISHMWNVTQISTGGLAPSLLDRDAYPGLYRIYTSLAANNPVELELFKRFKWTRVAAIVQALDIFTSIISDLVELLKINDITLITNEIFQDDPKSQIENLRRHDARIIVTGVYEDMAVIMVCEAYKQKFYGEHIVWFMVGFYDSSWWKKTSGTNCTVDQILEVLDGQVFYVGSMYKAMDSLSLRTDRDAPISVQEHDDLYNELSQGRHLFGEVLQYGAFDAMWALGLALNDTLTYMRAQGISNPFSSIDYNDDELMSNIFNSFTRLDFHGLSGHKAFGNAGKTFATMVVSQQQGADVVTVCVYDRSKNSNFTALLDVGSGIRWKSGFPPRDATIIEYKMSYMADTTYIIFCFFATIGICEAVFVLIFTHLNRTKKVIQLSSPTMNNLILLGAVLCFLAVFFQQLPGVSSFWFCTMQFTLKFLGFSIVFGALFSKTWRVHVIFSMKSAKTVKIKDTQLLMLVGFIVFINVLLLIIWYTVDPIYVTKNNTTQTSFQPETDVLTQYQVGVCESDHRQYFVTVMYVIQGVLLGFGTFLAWETRKVKIDALNDSHLIGICVYNVVILSALALTLTFVIEDTTLLSPLTQGFLIVGTFLTQNIVFIPKVIAVMSGNADVKPSTMPTVSPNEKSKSEAPASQMQRLP